MLLLESAQKARAFRKLQIAANVRYILNYFQNTFGSARGQPESAIPLGHPEHKRQKDEDPPTDDMESSKVLERPFRSPVSRLSVCGSGAGGALGLGEGRRDSNPRLVTLLLPDSELVVTAVASGSQHSLFLLSDGRVLAAGENRDGQLGTDEESKDVLHVIPGLSSVAAVAAGERHSLALREDGSLFAWGSNEVGQLGLSSPRVAHSVRRPNRVSGLSEAVVAVAAGAAHSLALTRDGCLYAWGANAAGQLGLGTASPFELRPLQIRSLAGVPLGLVAAGGAHSVAVSTSGAVFAWGSNASGQLGSGPAGARHFPTQLKSLRYKGVLDVACGESHCLALTKEGQVLSWGSDSCGQLGHGRQENEAAPRLILELAGTRVARVAAGRAHSAALTDGGRLSTWGLGSSGQLALEHSSTRLTPAAAAAAATAYTAVFLGSDRTFLLSGRDEAAPCLRPGREPLGGHIFQIRLQSLQDLVAAKNFVALGREVENCLSNLACLNNSFLLPDGAHFGARGSNHGVDLDSLMRLHELLETQMEPKARDELTRDLRKAIEWGILGELSSSPPDVEALRAYLVLPWLRPFDDASLYRSLHVPLAAALSNLAAVPKKCILTWWAGLKTRHFNRILRIFRGVIVHILTAFAHMSREEEATHRVMLEQCLKILRDLNEINNTKPKVNYDAFYIHCLASSINLPADYLQTKSAATFAFCQYPFILNAEAKSVLLQTDARMQMERIFNQTNTQNFLNLFSPLNGLQAQEFESPVLHIHVSRANIVEDAIAQLLSFGSSDPASLKKPLKVEFAGEEADDAGGVKKEFFMLLRAEMLHPKLGMFIEHAESRLAWFAAQYYQDLVFYRLVGVVLGLAIYNGVIINMQTPLALYKKLLGRPVTLEDLTELSPTEGRSLAALLDYEGADVEEAFCLSFEVSIRNDLLDSTLTEELKPGGKDIPVNNDNRHEFVDLYVDFVLNKSVSAQFSAFAEGLMRVAPAEILRLFQPPELCEMLTGNEHYDWDEWERLTQYKGDFHRRHPVVARFWEAFHALSQEEKRQFLLFLTGCDRIPLSGMSGVVMSVQPTEGGDGFLPVAHTCFNLLDLPRYSSTEILSAKLRLAIQHHTGFSLV